MIVGMALPENLHLNGMETTIIDVIGKDEACKRLGVTDFREREGQQSSAFYILENFTLTVSTRGSFGSTDYRKIDFTVSENLRKIYPKSTERFEEIVNNIKHNVPELV